MTISLDKASPEAVNGFQAFQRIACGSWTVIVLLAVAGCASQEGKPGKRSKIDPKWGVEAPKKMIADGQPVPPGDGRYQVGKPYMVGGRMYYPREEPGYDRVGTASWYGSDFHGRETANGEVYDKDSLSAAHTTMPIPSYARITNVENGRSVLVRVNDRGPYVGDRLVDVSERAADMLGFKGKGLAKIRVQYVSRAPVEGSDQRMLVASLRVPGVRPTVVDDRTLIAQHDRAPSDGRVTGLVAERVMGPQSTDRGTPKPIVLASAATMPTPTSFAPTARSTPLVRTGPLLPPAPPAGVLGTLPATSTHTLAPGTVMTAPIRKPSSNSGDGVIEALPTSGDDAPMVLTPTPSNAGGIRIDQRAKVLPASIPSRYGPNGPTPAPRYSPSSSFAATTRPDAGIDAIANLLERTDAAKSARIDLGAYTQPDNAARVRDLMAPYGQISSVAIKGALGEKMTLVSLDLAIGVAPGEILAVADRLGIHDAVIATR